MKITLLFILLLLCSYIGISQSQTSYVLPDTSTLKLYSGNANKVFITNRNEEYTLCTDCIVDNINILQGINRKWKLITDTLYTEGRIHVRIDSLGNRFIYEDLPDGIITPGYVIWLHDSTFHVTSATYVKNNKYYISTGEDVTISGIDPVYPVSFVFIVDTTGHPNFIAGIPAAIPLDPPIDEGKDIQLTKGITFNAGATSPSNVYLESIYDENLGTPSEWAATSSGTITKDFDNLDNPRHLTKAAYVSSYNTNSQLIFTKAGNDTFNSATGQILKIWAYLNGGLGTNRFRMQFLNGAVAASNTITFNNIYGLNPNDSNQYQLVAIPLNAFTWNGGTVFNKLIIRNIGTDTSGAEGYYMDWIELQTGLYNIPPSTDYSNKLDSVHMTTTADGTDTLYTLKGYAKGVPINNIGTIRTHAGGSGSGSGISQIIAGYGQIQVNDSTTNNDTAVMATVARLLSDSTILSNRINLKLNISDTAAMLNPYLRKTDSTNSITGYTTLYQNGLKQNVLNGTGFVKSTASTISYDNSTYLTTVDTTNIANFSTKVRSLFSAIAPITYVNGLIGLSTSGVAAGNYTNANVTFDAYGRATSASNGSSGTGGFNSNIGSGYRLAIPNTNDLKTLFAVGATIDSTTNANALTITVASVAPVKETHTSGASISLANATTWLIVNPATILAALTVTLPASPTDGQDVLINFGGTITSGGVVNAITISPTPIDASTPDYIEAGEHIAYRWNSTNSKWYRTN